MSAEYPETEGAERLRIVILGSGKSGTSGLFHCIRSSADHHFDVPFARLFEPHEQGEVTAVTDPHLVCKILIERFRGFEQPRRVLDLFDRKILIVRDPRDNVISRLMWIVATRIGNADSKDAAVILDALRQKEREPDSISVHRLFELAAPVAGSRKDFALLARNISYLMLDLLDDYDDLHLLKYEDFVDRKFDALEAYLGFPLLKDFEVPKKATRILRTGKYGNWANWFLDEDYAYFVDPVKADLERLGYADERPVNPKRVIDPEEVTEYVKRVQDGVAKRQQRPPGKRRGR